ncbi:MAG: CBS domain-containing protein [Deltaproteobacteria bacterium]|nr:CBS domain-containing protein [Deltaproteobacteria bacterium]
MEVAEIMTREPLSVTSDARVADALELMHDNDIRHVPVIDDGELIGMLSDRDLRDFLRAEDGWRKAQGVSVSEVMSADAISVEPGSDVSELIDLMLENKIGAIPVVDGHSDKVVGIVSYVDVLAAARELL